jgi:hypothetical protein
MTRPYASFLLRCWRLSAAERRITIEHIQSRAMARVMALAAALA